MPCKSRARSLTRGSLHNVQRRDESGAAAAATAAAVELETKRTCNGQPRFRVGARVSKLFFDPNAKKERHFAGVVDGYVATEGEGEGFYSITYEDSDREDVSEKELATITVPHDLDRMQGWHADLEPGTKVLVALDNLCYSRVLFYAEVCSNLRKTSMIEVKYLGRVNWRRAKLHYRSIVCVLPTHTTTTDLVTPVWGMSFYRDNMYPHKHGAVTDDAVFEIMRIISVFTRWNKRHWLVEWKGHPSPFDYSVIEEAEARSANVAMPMSPSKKMKVRDDRNVTVEALECNGGNQKDVIKEKLVSTSFSSAKEETLKDPNSGNVVVPSSSDTEAATVLLTFRTSKRFRC